ncbi:pseudouridine synthase [Ochromonadaceae sp. CCMP2298]|nr:pseudouridine synthase [Ochromonadaceae sp. CCMP2298]
MLFRGVARGGCGALGARVSLLYRGLASASTPASASAPEGLRINRCFPQYSRTQADRLITEGRVKVNGSAAECGQRVHSGDHVSLDGTTLAWEQHADRVGAPLPKGLSSDNGFVYIKYYKAVGTNTTTSPRDSKGVLNTGHFRGLLNTNNGTSSGDAPRLMPVGRLDNQSSGVLLLTSDARLPAWLLGATSGCSKQYEVQLDRTPQEQHLQQWREGMQIATPDRGSRTGRESEDWHRFATRPCRVQFLQQPQWDSRDSRGRGMGSKREARDGGSRGGGGGGGGGDKGVGAGAGSGSWVEFMLREGRNRQIRRMVEGVGLRVRRLHRSSFCGVGLQGSRGQALLPGQWAHLTQQELQLLRDRN